MGQGTDQIERHISRKRQDLRSNLDELEDKVKSATDWRQYVRNNPVVMLAVAFSGGLLAASITKRGRARAERAPPPSPEQPEVGAASKSRALRTWRNIQGALVGAAAERFQEKLAEIVPGFREQLMKGEPVAGGPVQAADANRKSSVQGEGNYEAAREYRRQAEQYVRRADIEQAARDAAPRDEREAEEMKAAEEAGRRRAHGTDSPAH